MEWWWMMVDDARLASAQWNRCCIAMSRPTLAFFNDSWGYLHKWLRFPKTGVKFETQLEDLSTWDFPQTGNTENHQPLNPASDILKRTCLSLSQFLFCLLGRFPESYLDMINFWKVRSVFYLAPSWLSLVYFAKYVNNVLRQKFPRNGKSWKIHPHRRCRSKPPKSARDCGHLHMFHVGTLNLAHWAPPLHLVEKRGTWQARFHWYVHSHDGSMVLVYMLTFGVYWW